LGQIIAVIKKTMSLTFSNLPTSSKEDIVIHQALREVALDLAAYDYSSVIASKNSGLFDGATGLSLFYFEMFRMTSQRKYLSKAMLFFEEAYKNLSKNNFNLSHGSCGTMWLMNYFVQAGILSKSHEDFLIHFDRLLCKVINSYSHNIDPMHGLLSIANYLFARNNSENVECLKKILMIVYKNKKKFKRGIAWESHSYVPEIGNCKHINFGYAHGNLAVLYFLSKYIKHDIGTSLSRSLFESGMEYFLSFASTTEQSTFPNRLDGRKRVYGSKIGYCYGDLGLACGFSAIANNLDRSDFRQMAMNLGRRVANNVFEKGNLVYDIGLCHGAAGNAYMLLKLFRELNDDILLQASLKQYRQLLTLKHKENGIVGFTSIAYETASGKFSRKSNHGFIEGVAGMGISIVSFLDDRRLYEWDQILYLT
jgi:lantibiotic biosynthesis protein